jgi:hypothetical protein
MQRAKAGNESAASHLRAMLEDFPVLCRDTRDLMEQTQDGWLKLLTGSDLSQRVMIEHQLQSLRKELGGFNVSVAERLLIDRILICWLQLAYADRLLLEAQNGSTRVPKEQARRQAAAAKQYATAIKQLAQVKRLERSSPRQPKSASFRAGGTARIRDPLLYPGDVDPLRHLELAQRADAATYEAPASAYSVDSPDHGMICETLDRDATRSQRPRHSANAEPLTLNHRRSDFSVEPFDTANGDLR